MVGHETSEESSAPAAPVAEGAWGDVNCYRCGYRLRGIDSPRCPECGWEIDPALLGPPPIPWIHRRTIGRVRAFWQTLWPATFRPYRLARWCMASRDPLTFRDAHAFERVVMGIVAGAVVGLLVLLHLVNRIAGRGPSYGDGEVIPPLDLLDAFEWSGNFVIAPWSLVVTIVGGLLTVPMLVRLHRWFFHLPSNPRRHARAVALSCLACAPLAVWAMLLLVLTAWNALVTLTVPEAWHRNDVILAAIVGIAVLLGLLMVLLMPLGWVNVLVMLRLGLGASAGRVFLAAILLPVLWATTIIGVQAVLHTAVSLITLAWVTLR